MYLFIDTLSDPTYIALFDEKREIIDVQTWLGKQHEFDTLTEEIDALMIRNSVLHKNLSGIVVMIWPWGFTGTRVTTLVANALNYWFNTPLFPLTVGEFFLLQKASLPWIIPITKKEVLLWKEKTPDTFTIAPILDLPAGPYTSLSPIDFANTQYTIQRADDYAQVISKIPLITSCKQVKPLYARDPNITKKISHAY